MESKISLNSQSELLLSTKHYMFPNPVKYHKKYMIIPLYRINKVEHN